MKQIEVKVEDGVLVIGYKEAALKADLLLLELEKSLEDKENDLVEI